MSSRGPSTSRGDAPASSRPAAPTRGHTRGTRAGSGASAGVGRWWGIEGSGGKVHESRGGDILRGRPVGGRSDRAGLPGCADAWRTPAALGGVARPGGRSPHSSAAPGSRTHRCRTPSRTPPRGTAPSARPRAARRTPPPRADDDAEPRRPVVTLPGYGVREGTGRPTARARVTSARGRGRDRRGGDPAGAAVRHRAP